MIILGFMSEGDTIPLQLPPDGLGVVGLRDEDSGSTGAVCLVSTRKRLWTKRS